MTGKKALKTRRTSPRMGYVTVGSAQPDRLLRVWRRVLERRLRNRLKARVRVFVHDNTHTMMTYQKERGTWRFRLHHMFLAAPDAVLSALSHYVLTADAESSAVLDRFIERNRVFIRRLPPEKLRQKLKIEPRGRWHDLEKIYRDLNRRFFRNRVKATITYGAATRKQGPRKSIKMGSYSEESRVIRIHPALDKPGVPRFFVEWIVFHEMLHDVHRSRKVGGRRLVHTPEFLEAERRFPAYEKAVAWEDRNLDMLLDDDRPFRL